MQLVKVQTEEHLQSVVCSLFPKEKIFINVRKESSLKSPTTGQCLELDVYIPHLKLCFEFQDLYHYGTTGYSHQSLEEVKRKDKTKEEMVEMRGDTFISVPYWWNGQPESLASTIRLRRPELLIDYSLSPSLSLSPPIPTDPPTFKKGIPEFGELMLASFPTSSPFVSPSSILSSSVLSSSVLSSWWLGEKYDGVRCFWHSSLSKLYTRSGIELLLPSILINSFVNCNIDGEIWFGRSTFSESQQLIQSSSYPSNLHFFRIIAFDNPMNTDSSDSYELRFSRLLLSIPFIHPFLIVPGRKEIKTGKLLKKIAKQILKESGEGVMLIKNKSPYVHGRSSELLKIKAVRADKEALVVSASRDFYILQLPNGNKFKIERGRVKEGVNPVAGDIVTISYQNISKVSFVPILSFVQRIRSDVSWVSLVLLESSEKNLVNQLNVQSNRVIEYAPRTYGYWVHTKRKQMRTFFEKILLFKMGLDPNNPNHWYSVSPSLLRKIPGVKSILKKFEGSLDKAIMYLFPDIGLEQSNFSTVHNSNSKRRHLFDLASRQLHVDPRVAVHWPILEYELRKIKDIDVILKNDYGNHFTKAILDLYPEIRNYRNIADFPGYWGSRRNRKSYFDSIAKEYNFDPYSESNWYTVYRIILAKKDTPKVLKFYQGSLVKAVESVYGISIDKNKLGQWDNKDKRKLFFESVAKKYGLNPRVPNDWYQLHKSSVLSQPGAKEVLEYYGGNIPKAIVTLYPNIGLEKNKFDIVSRGYWSEKENRKEFFDQFARENDFDPLLASNWNIVPKQAIFSRKNSSSVLKYYNGSITNALEKLYSLNVFK